MECAICGCPAPCKTVGSRHSARTFPAPAAGVPYSTWAKRRANDGMGIRAGETAEGLGLGVVGMIGWLVGLGWVGLGCQAVRPQTGFHWLPQAQNLLC